MADFDVSLAKLGLKTKYIGRKIVHMPVTVTTMNDAEFGAKQGDPNGTVYIADRMTGARGTKGRNWVAESSGNLYMSYILHIDLEEGVDPYADRSREFDLDIAGALSTLQALKEIGLSGVTVKWLNDLWIRGHKLLGALTEYKGRITVDSKVHHLYILGIGLNINCDMRRDPDMHTISTSVICELGHGLTREDVFSRICNHIEPLLEMDRRKLLKLYTEHETIKPGDKVMAQPWKNTNLCYFEGVKEKWSVDLKDENGEIFSASCTEVSLRPFQEKVVYILNDPHIETWSYKLLVKTCGALIDTQKYEVKYVMAEHISLEVLSSCALIVIGHHKAMPTNARYMATVVDYTKRGGSCLCIGNAYHLLEINASFTTEDQNKLQGRPTVVTTIANEGHDDAKSKINLCLFHEPKKDFADHWKSKRVLAYRDSECAGQRAGYAARNYGDNNYAQNRADVLVSEFGKGTICVCVPNIEVSYADIEEHFRILRGKLSLLQETIYQRDCLFIEILKALGL